MSWGKVNIGSGGVGGKMFATISGSYPVGSTCVCTDTDTGKKLTVKPIAEQSDKCIFIIGVPFAGTWTVSCTNGEKTSDKVVEITEADIGKSFSVALNYTLYLVQNGVVNFGDTDDNDKHIFTLEAKKLNASSATAASVPVATYDTDSLTLTGNGGNVGIAYINYYVDFSDCDAIIATGSFQGCTVGTIGLKFIFVSAIGTYCLDNLIASQEILNAKTADTMTLDLSNVEVNKRKGYVGFVLINNGAKPDIAQLGDIYGRKEVSA